MQIKELSSDSRDIRLTSEFCDGKQLRALFGISRSLGYLLAAEGKIRSVSIRRPGAVRGKRLFDCTSIRSFLNKHEVREK